MQHQGYIVRLRVARHARVPRDHTSESKETCLGLLPGAQFNDTDVLRVCDRARWGVYSRLDNQRLDTQISQVKSVFVGVIGRIERCARSTSGHGKCGHGEFWAIREHQGNSVMTA